MAQNAPECALKHLELPKIPRGACPQITLYTVDDCRAPMFSTRWKSYVQPWSPLHLILLLLPDSDFWGWFLLLLLACTAVTGLGCHIEVVSTWSCIVDCEIEKISKLIYGMWAANLHANNYKSNLAVAIHRTIQNQSDLSLAQKETVWGYYYCITPSWVPCYS